MALVLCSGSCPACQSWMPAWAAMAAADEQPPAGHGRLDPHPWDGAQLLAGRPGKATAAGGVQDRAGQRVLAGGLHRRRKGKDLAGVLAVEADGLGELRG